MLDLGVHQEVDVPIGQEVERPRGAQRRHDLLNRAVGGPPARPAQGAAQRARPAPVVGAGEPGSAAVGVVLARVGPAGGHDCGTRPSRQSPHGIATRTVDPARPQIDGPRSGGVGPDPSAHAVASLQDHHLQARRGQHVGGGESRHARAHHQHAL